MTRGNALLQEKWITNHLYGLVWELKSPPGLEEVEGETSLFFSKSSPILKGIWFPKISLKSCLIRRELIWIRREISLFQSQSLSILLTNPRWSLVGTE